MFRYNHSCWIYIAPCAVKGLAFDGVWMGREEILKLVCYAHAVRKVAFLRPQV
jgi:hypothetical protein